MLYLKSSPDFTFRSRNKIIWESLRSDFVAPAFGKERSFLCGSSTGFSSDSCGINLFLYSLRCCESCFNSFLVRALHAAKLPKCPLPPLRAGILRLSLPLFLLDWLVVNVASRVLTPGPSELRFMPFEDRQRGPEKARFSPPFWE